MPDPVIYFLREKLREFSKCILVESSQFKAPAQQHSGTIQNDPEIVFGNAEKFTDLISTQPVDFSMDERIRCPLR